MISCVYKYIENKNYNAYDGNQATDSTKINFDLIKIQSEIKNEIPNFIFMNL